MAVKNYSNYFFSDHIDRISLATWGVALQSLDAGDTCHRKYELARHMQV